MTCEECGAEYKSLIWQEVLCLDCRAKRKRLLKVVVRICGNCQITFSPKNPSRYCESCRDYAEIVGDCDREFREERKRERGW